MRTLYKAIKLVYPGDPGNGKRFDVLVEDATIKKIGKDLTSKADEVIDRKGALLFPSLVDSQCTVGQPGFEHRESFESLSKAAKIGGFGDLILLPNTDPVVDNTAQLEYIKRSNGIGGVRLHAYGAITKGTNGKELSEMFDMHSNGALAFSDGKIAVADVNMMKRALDYARNFDGLVISYPNDERLSPGGMVNESPDNTLLGLKSKPELAEELMLNRDLYLLKYTGGKMHVSTISTSGSVDLIKQAKKGNQDLSAGVALPNLLFTEAALNKFDTNYKVEPPLRSEKTVASLRKAVQVGTIDVICTDHTPQDIESKDVEFDHAAYGMTMLESALSLINMNLIGPLAWDDIIRSMAVKPRELFGLPQPQFKEKSSFDFVVFDPKEEWEYNKKTCASKSHNSPFLNQTLIGKVI